MSGNFEKISDINTLYNRKWCVQTTKNLNRNKAPGYTTSLALHTTTHYSIPLLISYKRSASDLVISPVYKKWKK